MRRPSVRRAFVHYSFVNDDKKTPLSRARVTIRMEPLTLRVTGACTGTLTLSPDTTVAVLKRELCSLLHAEPEAAASLRVVASGSGTAKSLDNDTLKLAEAGLSSASRLLVLLGAAAGPAVQLRDTESRQQRVERLRASALAMASRAGVDDSAWRCVEKLSCLGVVNSQAIRLGALARLRGFSHLGN